MLVWSSSSTVMVRLIMCYCRVSPAHRSFPFEYNSHMLPSVLLLPPALLWARATSPT